MQLHRIANRTVYNVRLPWCTACGRETSIQAHCCSCRGVAVVALALPAIILKPLGGGVIIAVVAAPKSPVL